MAWNTASCKAFAKKNHVFRSAPNLRIFVKEVLEVVRKVNDTLLHLGDVAPPIELNFTQELWIVCHLNNFIFNSIWKSWCNFSIHFPFKMDEFVQFLAPEVQLSLKHISSDLANVGRNHA